MSKNKTDIFIEKSNIIHKNKYDYSLSNYINSTTKIYILCKEHGLFKQTPNNHLSGNGCRKCSYIIRTNKSRNTKKLFIEKSNIIHKNKYDYSLVNYINNKSKVEILCPIHGIFEQRPNRHLSGSGCFMCFGTIKKTDDDFIIESISKHGNKYDYSLVDYINTNTKVKIICKIHGIFEKTPKEHINGKSIGGCQKCQSNFKINIDKFIEKSMEYHGNRYDYSKSIIINSHTPTTIICKKHGEYNQQPYKHMNEHHGCPKCKISKGVDLIIKNLSHNNIKYELECKIDNCLSNKGNMLLFDIFLNSSKIYIEYDGEHHFLPIKSWGGEKYLLDCKERDDIKNKFCLENNIKLYRIAYTDNILIKLDSIIKEHYQIIKDETYKKV